MLKMIYASFREPNGIFSNWFNQVAATFTGGDFCHSEFIFEWSKEELAEALQHAELEGSSLNRLSFVDDKIHLSMYVMWGMRVGYRVLSHDAEDPFCRMPDNHLVPVSCGFEDEKKLFTWCMDQCGKDYDKVGAIGCFIPVRSWKSEYNTYFCSQLMACGLNHIHLTSVNPGSTTPNSLYALLQKERL